MTIASVRTAQNTCAHRSVGRLVGPSGQRPIQTNEWHFMCDLRQPATINHKWSPRLFCFFSFVLNFDLSMSSFVTRFFLHFFRVRVATIGFASAASFSPASVITITPPSYLLRIISPLYARRARLCLHVWCAHTHTHHTLETHGKNFT